MVKIVSREPKYREILAQVPNWKVPKEIKEDVKKFSHSLRDFRNYIHPFEQLCSRFIPDEHTAKICLQVFQAAIYQISSFT